MTIPVSKYVSYKEENRSNVSTRVHAFHEGVALKSVPRSGWRRQQLRWEGA